MLDAFTCAIVCPAAGTKPLPPEIDPLSSSFSLGAAADEARRRAEAALQHAENAADGAALVVLPEDIHGIRHFWRAREAPRLFQRIAEPVPGPTSDAASRIARRHRTHVVLSMYENDAATIHHATILIGPRGKALVRYRKVHVAPGEDWVAAPGAAFTVAATDLGRIGIACGEDWLFPETACVLARLDAEIVVCPSKRPIPENVLALRSADHGFITVFAHPPGSIFLDQRGRILAQSAGRRDLVIRAELRNESMRPADRDTLDGLLTNVPERRPRLSAFRRPEAYAPLTAAQWPEAHVPRKDIDAYRERAYRQLSAQWASEPTHVPDWEL